MPSLAAVAPGQRTYDEAAVGEILKRAVKLEQGRAHGDAGLTLEELEQVARDAGLDPMVVRQAARDFEATRDRSLAARLAGSPLRQTVERVVAGEISATDHEALAGDIRAGLEVLNLRSPVVTSMSRSLTVRPRGDFMGLEVSLTPYEGKTLIRTTVNHTPVLLAFFVPTLVLNLLVPMTLVAGRADPGAAALVTGFVGATGAAYLMGRALLRFWSRRFERALAAVGDTLARRIEEKARHAGR